MFSTCGFPVLSAYRPAAPAAYRASAEVLIQATAEGNCCWTDEAFHHFINPPGPGQWGGGSGCVPLLLQVQGPSSLRSLSARANIHRLGYFCHFFPCLFTRMTKASQGTLLLFSEQHRRFLHQKLTVTNHVQERRVVLSKAGSCCS